MPQATIDNGTSRILEDFSERFSPAIRGVVEFAKRIPGFSMLSQEDQVTLLKVMGKRILPKQKNPKLKPNRISLIISSHCRLVYLKYS